MHAADLEAVAHHLAKFDYHYGSLKNPEDRDTLRKLLIERGASGLILQKESQGGDETEIIALGITGFLDRTIAENILENGCSTPVVEYLYARERQGEPVFLRPQKQAESNHREGLVLIFLHFSAPAGDPDQRQTQQAMELMQSSFRLHNGGYYCDRVLHPAPGGDSRGVESLKSMGFEPVGGGEYLFQFDVNRVQQIPFHPFSCLLRVAPPFLGLSAAEKELLNLALWSNSDSDIAISLNISLETVRKRWRSIYQKFKDHPQVDVFPDNNQTSVSQTRGPEKRKRVLQFLDAHLQEVRPFLSGLDRE